MKLAAFLLFFGQEAPAVRWQVTPEEVELGQPFTCALEVPHPPGATPAAPELELDYGWEVVDGPEVRPLGEGTRLAWTVLALEAVERELPALDLALGDGSRLRAGGGEVTVRGVLAPDEDAPPPMPGFRTVPERTSPVRPRHLGLALLGLAVLAGGGVLLLVRSHRARPEREPSELERFQGLAPAGAPRGLGYELAALLRSAAERSVAGQAPKPGLTDEEWLAALRAEGSLGGEDVDELESLLAVCADLRYAGARPTRFAALDLLGRAEALLRRLSAREREEVPA